PRHSSSAGVTPTAVSWDSMLYPLGEKVGAPEGAPEGPRRGDQDAGATGLPSAYLVQMCGSRVRNALNAPSVSGPSPTLYRTPMTSLNCAAGSCTTASTVPASEASANASSAVEKGTTGLVVSAAFSADSNVTSSVASEPESVQSSAVCTTRYISAG